MDKNRPHDDELRRIDAEAAELPGGTQPKSLTNVQITADEHDES
jgi:hypothetical protein